MNDSVQIWIKPLLLLFGVPALAALLRMTLVKSVERLVTASSTRMDDLLARTLKPYLLPWAGMLGLALALQASPLEESWKGWLFKANLALALMSATLAASSLAVAAMEDLGARQGLKMGALSLTRASLRVSIVALGALWVLSNLGVSITPLLTALGVGSLAVALALQDTLSNLFAGIHIMASGSIKADDYLKLDSGQEGYVADIGWRATRICELAGNIIIVPNNRLAQAVITNFNCPAKDLAVLVNLGVAYSSDLEKVEDVVSEVGRQVMLEVQGGVKDFAPFIRFNQFSDSAINFTVILRAGQFADRYLVTHEFIKRLQRRFREENIEIPFPQRVVTLQQQG